MDNPKLLGMVFGLVIGVVTVWQGPLEAFIVGLFVVAGFLIGKYVGGEIPILDILLERFASRRGGPRR